MRPAILLTGGQTVVEGGAVRHWVPDAYARAVYRAGGLPSLAVSASADYADPFDGLLLTGGADVDPAWFGEAVLNDTVEIDPERDNREKKLFFAFLRANKPIFGICRGIQVLAALLGGALYQDLPAQRGLQHSGRKLFHDVTLQPAHWMARRLGEITQVNSFHHQAIRVLPDCLTPVGWSEDGLVEAVEHVSAPVWGVQWHPERMVEEQKNRPSHEVLFERFVLQCRTH